MGRLLHPDQRTEHELNALRDELGSARAALSVLRKENHDLRAENEKLSKPACPSGGSRTPESPLGPLLRALGAVHDDLVTVTARMDTDPGAAHEALELIRVTLRQLLEEQGIRPGAWN